MHDIGTLKRLRDDLDKVIRRMEDLEASKPARTHPIVIETGVSASILNQLIISFSSRVINPAFIVPEAPVTVEMPQINTRYQTTIAAQYRLTSRREIGLLLDQTKPTKNDQIRLELLPNGVWKVSIRKKKNTAASK